MSARVSLVAAALIVVTVGVAWADGPRGGVPGGKSGAGVGQVPGRSGAAGGDLLGERRARNRRLDLVAPNPRTAVAPPEGQPTPGGGQGRGLVHLHHGSVHMVAGLARVDLTLEVQNVGPQPMEWQRVYAIDPVAEVIGAVLQREGEDAITARTLTSADAARIYAEVRTPPPTRRPRGNRDPLLLQRPSADRLHVSIWPIGPGETIRVALTFVTPLRGRGARRTYVDVMGGPARAGRPPRLSRPNDGEPDRGGRTVPVAAQADWLVDPGDLVLSSAPGRGMTLRGQSAGLLQFTGRAATEGQSPRPSVSFLTAKREKGALLVGSGSLGGRIAVWRFDPQEFLVSHGFELREPLDVRLVPARGNCSRLAPHFFAKADEPLPVTALLLDRSARTVRYGVEVLGSDGEVIATYHEALPLHREDLDEASEDALSGWHRAALVHRVFQWAGGDGARQLGAQRFAVDMGVLVGGSAALAVPASERRRMSQRSRRLYDRDGVPLGAPRHEADLRAVPRGALRD